MDPPIPSSFLPHLPRAQNTFDPISPYDLLTHIALLKELYLPPIHGGLQAADTFYDDDDELADADKPGPSRGRRMSEKERRFSVGLAESMDGLGLSTGVDIPSTATQSGFGAGVIHEEDIDCFEGSDDDGGLDEVRGDVDGDGEAPHLDPFEREWAQKWLEGVFRRAQTWLEEQEEGDEVPANPLPRPPGRLPHGVPEGRDVQVQVKEMEAVLREATAVLALMAGTSAAGSLTRHLLFPVDAELGPALRTMRGNMIANPNLSPETTSFLASLSTSPISPIAFHRRRLSSSPVLHTARGQSSVQPVPSELASSPTTTLGTSYSPSRRIHRRRPAIPILLHDAPMSDHLSVGVQTWGSAILLGRKMAMRPEEFGLVSPYSHRGVRVLELGAGTGLLSILCRKILDLKMTAAGMHRDGEGHLGECRPGIVVATDFLTTVLDNLKICIDLNFPASIADHLGQESVAREGINVAKLDWSTFPQHMEAKQIGGNNGSAPGDISSVHLEDPFDLVLASDCVYDPTHAELLRRVIGWVLRLPDRDIPGDIGGTFHILSPLRPTFAPELESIDTYFPLLSSYRPLAIRAVGDGEGLGRDRCLKIGVRGEGKRSARGKKGEGRTDETLGYWWWEVGWG